MSQHHLIPLIPEDSTHILFLYVNIMYANEYVSGLFIMLG